MYVETTAVHVSMRKAQLVQEQGKIVPPPPRELGLGSPLPAIVESTVYVDKENEPIREIIIFLNDIRVCSVNCTMYCMFRKHLFHLYACSNSDL